jgi:hypothetical protein
MTRFVVLFILFYILVPLGISYVSHISFWFSFVLTITAYFALGNLYDYYIYNWRR